jgi:ketosteroid isomerase-like protein
MRRLVLSVLSLAVLAACQPATTELTEERRAAIVEELTQAFDAYADVVRQLDHDALMVRFTSETDDVAWAHQGVVTRSWTDIAEVVRQNWAMFASVESFAWRDLHLQALAADIAVVTTMFDFVATDTAGAPIALNGTFSTVWLQTDGEWKIVNSAETYPPAEAAPQGN